MVKVNLLIDNPGDVRSGYVNIDPIAPQDCQDGRIRGDLHDLTHTVDAAEVEHLLALDILDYYPGAAGDQVLTHWLSRLARGGQLTLSVIDIREVSRGVLAGALSPEDLQELLYGRQEQAWQFKKAAYSLPQLVEVLARQGYKILSRRISNYRAVVTCQRVA